MQKGKMMDELSRWYENMTYQEAKDILREKLDNMKMNFIAAGYYMKYIRDHELFRKMDTRASGSLRRIITESKNQRHRGGCL